MEEGGGYCNVFSMHALMFRALKKAARGSLYLSPILPAQPAPLLLLTLWPLVLDFAADRCRIAFQDAKNNWALV